MKLILAAALTMATFAATSLIALADDNPPVDSKPLVNIIKTLEDAGYGPIVEAEFDDGNWEIEAYQEGQIYELLVDPANSEVISKHRDESGTKPPADSMQLSEVIASLTAAGYADVHDISFEGRNWEVEARRDGVRRELRISPQTGEVISDRADD